MAQPIQLDPVVINSDDSDSDTGVSLGMPAEQPDNSVSLSGPGSVTVVPSRGVADERSKKMQEGVGEHLGKTTEELRQEISDGREKDLRDQAAAKMNYQQSMQKHQMLIDLANSKGGPLDENEVATVLDPYNPKNQPVDPDSVVEKQYATKYIASIGDAIKAIPNSPVADAIKEIPDEVNEAFLKGTALTAKMEYARKLREDQEQVIKQQSTLGWIGDQAKGLFQPYTEYKMRGLTDGVGISDGVLLGSQLQAEADKVFSLPFEQFTKESKRIVEGLSKDNPTLAHKFAEYLEGISAKDQALDSIFTMAAPFDYATIGKAGLGLARKASLANRTNRAVRDFVQAADKIATDPAKRAENLGDIDTAAVKRSTDNILQDMNGQSDPIKIATDDSLLTFLNQSKDKLSTAPGNLSREQVVRIQDAYDASGKTLLQRIIDSARINRIPMPLAVENAVRIVKETIKDYYPGIRNAILDVSDPLYEPRSNTYWFETTFGNFGGNLFSSEKTAQNFAKLHGFNDAHIIEGNGPITPPKVQALLDRKAKVDFNVSDWEQTVARRRADAANPKRTPQERAASKQEADFIASEVKKAKQEADDIALKLRGEKTYIHVAQLDTEINAFRIKNKELRQTRKDKTIDPAVREHIEASIRFGEDQIKAKGQEINAIKSGKADVVRPVTVEQHGLGFKIVVRRPLVETDKAVRDLMIRDASGKLIPEAISTSSSTGLKSLMNAAIGKFRGADDTLALNESIQRKIGTYTQSRFKEWAKGESDYIRQIASGVIRKDPVTGETIPYWKAKPRALWNKVTLQQRQTYDEFVRTLDHARDAKDPDTGQTGYFFETPGQLNDHYLKFFDREPSFAEHEAYFAFVRIVEGDRILREISEFRNRARLGVEQHAISARGPDGKNVTSEFFDGKVHKTFPGGDEVMMIMGKRLGDEKLINLGGAGIGPKKLEEYRQNVKDGKLRVIEVYAPEHTPLRNFSDLAGNEHVRYILTDASESKPLEFNHVNRRGGGHFEYDYDHYLKQANMYHQYEGSGKGRYKSVYTGDTTFMPLLNRVMGRDIGRKMEVIQRLIREGDIDGAKRYTEANLPIEWEGDKGLYPMFKPSRDADGKVVPPKLDLHEPFVVVPNGKTIFDMDKSLEARYGNAFKDGTKSGSLNRQFSVAYNTERESSGMTHLEDIGTQGNPLYKYSPESRMVDPITTMNRALNRIVNTTFMDDYKIYAVEHWLREAETHMRAKDTEIAASPFWHFQSANDKSAFKPGTAPDVVRNLLSNRYKIQQFVGVPNSIDTAIHTATQWLTDTAYQAFGPEASRSIGQKAMTVVPLWMLGHIKDPVTFMRSMTFHAKLGLWNPAQLIVQAQTFANILALSPFHGTAGTYGAFLHGWSTINKSPEILKALDNYATKLNVFGKSKWRPGEFTEAMETLDKTGFNHVAGEYANLDTALKTDFVGNDFKNIANAGTIFFTMGEQSTRLGAWYTAFREFRDLKPTGALTKNDIGTILQRADLLTVNMSRASNSRLQGGVFSLSTQFLSYQIRMAELFMGTRLGATTGERNMARFRLLTFYSALYGAPSAIGLTGLPMAGAIRQEAIERGYTVGDNWIKSAVMEGLPAIGMALITGKGDINKGNNYNIGARYGSPGFTQLSDALKSDHSWWQLLAGASGTTLLNTMTASNNFYHVMGSMMQPSNKDKAFPLKLDDFVDLFKEISSVNQGWKAYAAINTGKWMSKNEAYIGDVTKANAAFMAMTGLSPQQQDDTYIKSNIKKGEVEMQKYYLKEFIQEYRRGVDAAKANNPQQAAEYYTRAFTMLEISGYPVSKKATAISIAAKGYETQIDSQDYAFAFKDAPKSKSSFLGVPMPFTTQSDIEQTRREQFRTQGQLNQYKEK